MVTEIDGTLEDIVVIRDGIIIEQVALSGTITDIADVDGTLREVEALIGTMEAFDDIEGELEDCP